jgi:hypothetical protein
MSDEKIPESIASEESPQTEEHVPAVDDVAENEDAVPELPSKVKDGQPAETMMDVFKKYASTGPK